MDMMKDDVAASVNATSVTRLAGDRRVLIVLGAGGVGKTTVTASLGVVGAQAGRRTLVMTIDPARRLAISLGLDQLDHEPRAVPLQRLRSVGLAPGLLFAAMLDQKRTFDEVVARHATDLEMLRRVQQNKLYRELSTRLAGGQEYAAMEKLHEMVLHGGFDLVVLDTPPAVNAIDFLEAPQKLVDLLDGPAVKLFVKSYKQVGRFSFKLLTLGSAYVFKRLARFVGSAFLDDVAAFFGDMHDLLGGFRERAAAVVELLNRPDVGFILVTSPDPRAVDETLALYERLKREGMVPTACIVNRVHETPTVEPSGDDLQQMLGPLVGEEEAKRRVVPLVLRSHQQLSVLARADAGEIRRLEQRFGDDLTCIHVPLLPGDIHDVDALGVLGGYLAD